MAEKQAKRSPSSPRLSVEDADRLADGFTAIWEEDEAATADQDGVDRAPAASTRGSDGPPELLDSFEDRTLPGIAPLSRPPPPSIPPEAMPAAPPAAASNLPGYAVAYTPKDGPLTPAVVIAPEFQSSPEANRRPLAATQPSLLRAALGAGSTAHDAAVAREGMGRDALKAASVGSSEELEGFDPAQFRASRKAKRIVLGGGALVLLGGALGLGLFGRAAPGEKSPNTAAVSASGERLPAEAGPEAAARSQAGAGPFEAPSTGAESAAPSTPTATTGAGAAVNASAASKPATPSAPESAAPAMPITQKPPAVAPRRTPVRPKAATPVAHETAAPATEPAPPTKSTPSRGGIVRDAPF